MEELRRKFERYWHQIFLGYGDGSIVPNYDRAWDGGKYLLDSMQSEWVLFQKDAEITRLKGALEEAEAVVAEVGPIFENLWVCARLGIVGHFRTLEQVKAEFLPTMEIVSPLYANYFKAKEQP